MLFATDIDRTIIYSKRVTKGEEKFLHCVEYYKGQPISFMTQSAMYKLNSLMDAILIVPVTTRSISQFNRVEVFSTTEYAIVDNGGVILHNGSPVEEWTNHIREYISIEDLEHAIGVFNKMNCWISDPKIIDNSLVLGKTENIQLCKSFLQHNLNFETWQLVFQRNKIYAIPRVISKCSALDFLCKNLITYTPPIIVAGDSKLDFGMLHYADIGLIPSDCIISDISDGLLKLGSSYSASEDILDFVISKI